MMAFENECGLWDDSVDYANMEAFDYEEIPDEADVMTTWHEGQTMGEVFRFSAFLASNPTVDLTLIIDISAEVRSKELLQLYRNVCQRET